MKIYSILRPILSIIISIIFVGACPRQIMAEVPKATIEDIIVTSSRDHLLLYFSVKEYFSEDIKRAISSGIKTTFHFYITLSEVRDLWWNKEVALIKIDHHIQYDTLKKVYLVDLPERNKSITYKDIDSAGKAMSEIVGLEVIALQGLKRGERYQIRMKAELDRITLPLYMHYVFFFVSLWDYETEWYSIDFRY